MGLNSFARGSTVCSTALSRTFVPASKLYACGFQDGFQFRVWRHREKPFDKSSLRTRLKQIRAETPANQNTECINYDGLARAGLAREQIEPAIKLHAQFVNQGDVRDIK